MPCPILSYHAAPHPAGAGVVTTMRLSEDAGNVTTMRLSQDASAGGQGGGDVVTTLRMDEDMMHISAAMAQMSEDVGAGAVTTMRLPDDVGDGLPDSVRRTTTGWEEGRVATIQVTGAFRRHPHVHVFLRLFSALIPFGLSSFLLSVYMSAGTVLTLALC